MSSKESSNTELAVQLDLEALGLSFAETNYQPSLSTKSRAEYASENYDGVVDRNAITTPNDVIAFTEIHAKGGQSVTKTLKRDGEKLKDAPKIKHWGIEQKRFDGITDLSSYLLAMAEDNSKALVLGEPTKAVKSGTENIRKASKAGPYGDVWQEPTLRGKGTRVLVIDHDDDEKPIGFALKGKVVDKAVRSVIKCDYPELVNTSCFYSLTSSQRPDGSNTRLRLIAVMDRHYSWAELARWVVAKRIAAKSKALDVAPMKANQIIYVAPPIRPKGVSDPIPNRMGVIKAEKQTVTLEIPPEKEKPNLSCKMTSSKAYSKGMIQIEREFSRLVDLEELLTDKGYEFNEALDKYMHPNSGSGVAGLEIFYDSDPVTCYSYNSGDPLAHGHRNDAFNVYVILYHGGDVKAARTAVGKAMKTSAGKTALQHNAQVKSQDVSDFDSFGDQSEPINCKNKLLVDEINKEYAVVDQGGDIKVARFGLDLVGNKKIDYYTRQSFYDKYAGKLDYNGDPLGSMWFKHPNRREYDAVVFNPGLPPEGEVGGVYNLWEGFAVSPIKGDCSRILKHLLEVVCGGYEDQYCYLLGWMARGIQQPAKVGYVAVVLRGGKGAGKSIISDLYGGLFGKTHKVISDGRQVTGQFTGHLQGTVMLSIEEAVWAGSKPDDSILKMLVTGDTLMYRAMYKDAVEGPNYLKIMMLSNEDWVVPATQDERRYFVTDLSDHRQGDNDYFDVLLNEINGGGREAFLHYLMEYDLAEFDVRNVPQTKGLQEQKRESLNHFQSWVLDVLSGRGLGDPDFEGDDWEKRVVTGAVLHDDYLAFFNRSGLNRYSSPWSSSKGKLFGIKSSPQRVVGKSATLRGYQLPTLETMRSLFEEVVGVPVEEV